MKNKKIYVGILFGGQSAEHDVSIKSTEALCANLDRDRYTPTLIHIDRQGMWRIIDEETFHQKNFTAAGGNSFLPWGGGTVLPSEVDIYFPMLHGPNGEDGKVQALLELAGQPYVGAGSLASALAMDKAVSKVLFRNAGLRVGDYLVFHTNDPASIQSAVEGAPGYPVFVKPSSMGSSVGISRVSDESELNAALDLAFRYDRKVVVEKALDVREIEVSVMGNDEIRVSRPGELIPHNRFYDYKDKYIDGKTTFHMPAPLEKATETAVRRIAGEAFKALGLNGMSRVDLFIEKTTGDIYINEINTIPGFTEISMFPKLWELEGISFTQLITLLIDYGFAYHETINKFAVDWRQ